MSKIIIALFAFAVSASAGQYSMELRPESTKVEWTLKDVLHTVHGTFALKNGSIDFDTGTGKASGRIVVDVTSGVSGNETRDHRMHANVLESQKYPEAVFSPDRIDGSIDLPGNSNVKVHGTFTIHGMAHEITINAQTRASNDSITADLTFEIPYVAWGMKDPSNLLLKVNKTVQLSVETTAALKKN